MRNAGGCVCGSVRYETQGEPLRVTICHCRFCQRSTGSAYLVEPIFAKSHLEVTSGELSVYGHVSEGSGKRVDVHFCEVCGTKLYLSFERFPDVVGLYGGTYDDPNWFEYSARNSRHIFLKYAQRGTIIPGGFNAFEEHAMTREGTAVPPQVFDAHLVIEGGGECQRLDAQ